MEKVLKETDITYIIQEICETLTIELPKMAKEPQQVFMDGELFCKTLYQVTTNDQGLYVIEIDGEIIRDIGAGNHKLLIETEDGYISYNLNIQ